MGLIKFEMRARYWDPVKEQREARLKEIKAMQDDSIEAVKTRISRRFQGKYNEYYSEKRQAMRKQNMILLAALISVIFAAYFFLIRFLPVIENWLDRSINKKF